MLKAHFDLKPLTVVERYHFNRRDQSEGETISAYLAELRCLAATCDFGDQLNVILRDWLVCGRHAGIKRRLMTEADLTLEKALKTAQSMEAAETNSKTLKVSENAESVDKLSEKSSQVTTNRVSCY